MHESPELKLSLLVCGLFTGVYLVYSLVTLPSGGHPLGHTLGIVGTLLMVATETLYSLRKRTNWFRQLGPVRWWLSAHIVTGIVGPFLVLTHTAFEFRGLAGFTMGLAAVVMASGFVGRYFYTAIPRSLAGTEESAQDLSQDIAQIQTGLSALTGQRSTAGQALVDADAQRPRVARSAVWLVLLYGWDTWRYRQRLHAQVRRLERTEKQHLGELEKLLNQRRNLER
jgi:hypothetical protein